MSRTNRREFLARSAAMSAAGMAASLVPADLLRAADRKVQPDQKELPVNAESLPIVDTHQHLWDLKKFQLPWLKGDAVQAINRSFVLDDYERATAGLNVVGTVYMEVNVHPAQQAREADHVIDLCGRDDNSMQAAVIGGFPHSPSFAKYITQYGKNRFVRGVRTVLHDADRPRGLCLQPLFVENMKRLGRLGLSFDLCMRPDEIGDGARLAGKCPDTRFIIDHCGNMSVASTDKKVRKAWQEGLRAAAALENTVCKISGIVVTAENEKWKPADLAPNVNFCLETFGDDRCFFGGDWPVCTLKSSLPRWIEALQTIVADRPPAFRRKLFHDNAVKFYRLG